MILLIGLPRYDKTMHHKLPIRQRLLAERHALTAATVAAASILICKHAFESTDWSAVRRVHCYEPMPGSGEIDTAPLIEMLAGLPKPPQISIVEPKRDAPIPFMQYDVVIVPILGFNRHRHRLGWGGGWYDRFLATQVHARTIGLAYASSVVAFADEPHDIALDCIATESGII